MKLCNVPQHPLFTRGSGSSKRGAGGGGNEGDSGMYTMSTLATANMTRGATTSLDAITEAGSSCSDGLECPSSRIGGAGGGGSSHRSNNSLPVAHYTRDVVAPTHRSEPVITSSSRVPLPPAYQDQCYGSRSGGNSYRSDGSDGVYRPHDPGGRLLLQQHPPPHSPPVKIKSQ